MFETVDLYCERLSPGLWAEPINAFTNLSFLVAAFSSYYLAKRYSALLPSIWMLIGLMALIGAGSFVFHTLANTWSRIADVVPILAFQVAFLWVYARQVIGMHRAGVVGIVFLFLCAAYLGRQFPDLLNGSLIYAPAFALVLGLGIFHWRNKRRGQALLLWATVVFATSLFFRTIDLAVCNEVPTGTHFLWHLLNGLLVYLATRSLIVNVPLEERKGNG